MKKFSLYGNCEIVIIETRLLLGKTKLNDFILDDGFGVFSGDLATGIHVSFGVFREKSRKMFDVNVLMLDFGMEQNKILVIPTHNYQILGKTFENADEMEIRYSTYSVGSGIMSKVLVL